MPFGYFGSKRRLAPTYPMARYDTIIEPFAGAAGYGLRGDHWIRNVILIDNNPDVIKVWRWLQGAEPDDIQPEHIERGDYPVPIGSPLYWVMRWSQGSANNPNVVSEWMARDWHEHRLRLASELHKVRHWQIIEGDYRDAPNIKATWFIDPPYQYQGHEYTNGSDGINYEALGDWCRTRSGQVIVCEQEPADWLPFEHHTSNRTQANKSVSELIWTNEPALRLFR